MLKTHDSLNLVRRAAIVIGMLTFASLIGLISILIVQICFTISLIIFVLIPLVFRYSITLQRGVLFLTFITYPRGLDLSKPESVGLYATRNFYVKVNDPESEDENEVSVGAWHVLPLHLVKRYASELNINENEHEELQNLTAKSIIDEETHNEMEHVIRAEFPIVDSLNEKHFYERMLKLPGTVVLYLHGNTATRGSGHRIDIYKLLRKLGYHVITMDYRGYGDSAAISPTEEGVVRDALAVYEYISNITNNPIIVWGHSLGTGVTTNLCAQLNFMHVPGPAGVILESPFTNIREEIRQHPFARLYRDLPWFEATITEPMYSNSLRFESDQHVSKFRQPILILHAENDHVVPFQLGYKLYRIALSTRGKSWGPVEFHRFDAALHYGHKFMVHDPQLPEIVKRFVDTYRNEVY